MSRIQAGGAAVVITANDQTAAGVQSASRRVQGLQANFSKVGGQMQAFTKFGQQLQSQFAGMAAGAATINVAFRSLADSVEASLTGATDDFFGDFATRFSEAFQSIPVLGAIAKLGSLLVDTVTGSLEEAAELAEFEQGLNRRREQGVRQTAGSEQLFGEALNAREQIDRQREDREIRSLANLVQVRSQSDLDQLGGRVNTARFRQEEIVRRRGEVALATAIADIEARASEANALEVQTGVDAEGRIKFARNPAVDQAIEAQRRLIEAQVQQEIEAFGVQLQDQAFRAGSAFVNAQREEQAKIDAERIATAERVASIQGDLQSRIADARLAAEDAGLGDTPAERARSAEVAAQRELLRIEGNLQRSERQLLADRQLSDEQRAVLLAAERDLAEIERSQVAARLAAAQHAATAGSAQADSITGSAFGTFSALAAARSSVSADRIQADQLKALVAIERNTQAGATF